MPPSLALMRGTLASWAEEDTSRLARTAVLLDAPAEIVARVLELTPAANGRVAATSKAMRAQLAALHSPAPAYFHVFIDEYPGATDSQRRDSMLTALESQARLFRLLAIEIPDFILDEDTYPRHTPPSSRRRGAHRASPRCCRPARISRRSTSPARGSTGGPKSTSPCRPAARCGVSTFPPITSTP